MKIHLGKLILAKLKEKKVSKSEFARRINKSRQNVQDIFKRESLDTNLLLEINKALNFNFFEVLAGQSPTQPDKDLLNQLKIAQKEIAYLTKINSLLEKK